MKNKDYSKSESSDAGEGEGKNIPSVIPVLVLGTFLRSDSSGNKHFRFFIDCGEFSWMILRLLDFVVLFCERFTLAGRIKRILFPSDIFARIIKLINYKINGN